MSFKYLNGKSWQEITREERVFCFELFEIARKNMSTLLNLLERTPIPNAELGIEVCFYRDVLFDRNQSIRNSLFPQKRTFDLVVFLPNEIIIIEAKVSQGFEKKQLNDIKKDKGLIQSLLSENELKVSIVALISSKYQMKKSTKEYFNSDAITWKQLAEFFPSKQAIFKRADDLYGKC